jgi:hypothetical protein
MKTILTLILLFCASLAFAENEEPTDLYLNCYLKVQKAAKYEGDGTLAEALAALPLYQEAAAMLKDLKAKYPDWQPQIVAFREAKINEAIQKLELKTAKGKKSK